MKHLMCLICFAIVGCGPSSSEFVKLSSTVNSESNLAATWSEASEGATTSFVYRLHIHENNSPLDFEKNIEILRTDSILDTTLAWQSKRVLKITCLRGDVYFWINRSILEGHDVRVELDSQCSETVSDRWFYIEPDTEADKLPEVIRTDPRVQKSLAVGNGALSPNTALRVLYNSERTKEVIEIRQH